MMKRVMHPINTRFRPVGLPPVAETLPGAIERIVSELKPEKIILFGSYAFDNSTPDGEVYLLVIMNTKAKEIDSYVSVSNLLYPRQFSVDVLVKTRREVEAASRKKGNIFIREILAKGTVIYERPSGALQV